MKWTLELYESLPIALVVNYEKEINGELINIEINQGFCSNCTTKLTDIRGFGNEIPNGIELHALGKCPNCETFDPLNVRYYYDEDRILFNVNDEWINLIYKPNLFTTIENWFYKIKTYLLG